MSHIINDREYYSYRITLALRVSDRSSAGQILPTYIQNIIERYGYAWIGRESISLYSKTVSKVLSYENPAILLMYAGQKYSSCYWAYVSEITKLEPSASVLSQFHNAQIFPTTWIKVTRVEHEEKSFVDHCTIESSQKMLGDSLMKSKSPYFIVYSYIPKIDDHYLIRKAH